MEETPRDDEVSQCPHCHRPIDLPIKKGSQKDLSRLIHPNLLNALKTVAKDFTVFLPPALKDWMDGVGKTLKQLQNDIEELKKKVSDR